MTTEEPLPVKALTERQRKVMERLPELDHHTYRAQQQMLARALGTTERGVGLTLRSLERRGLVRMQSRIGEFMAYAGRRWVVVA